MKNEIKRYIGIFSCAAIFGLASLVNPGYTISKETENIVQTENIVLKEKVEKIKDYLRNESFFQFAGIHMGDFTELGDVTKLDNLRSGLVLYDDEEGKEAVGVGISKKGDLTYFLTGDSEIELFDYQDNGYGEVDEISVYDGKELKNLENPTKEEKSIANQIYKLVLDEFDEQVIQRHIDTERFKNVGKELEKLIEELKK